MRWPQKSKSTTTVEDGKRSVNKARYTERKRVEQQQSNRTTANNHKRNRARRNAHANASQLQAVLLYFAQASEE